MRVWRKWPSQRPVSFSMKYETVMYIILQYCHFVRISAVGGRWRNLCTTSRRLSLGLNQEKSWPGWPVRWERASSRVTWVVVQGSCRMKSEPRMDARGDCHVRGVLVLAVSSMRREIAAAVKDLVVEPV